MWGEGTPTPGWCSIGCRYPLWAHLSTRVSLQGEPALLEGVLLGEPVSQSC